MTDRKVMISIIKQRGRVPTNRKERSLGELGEYRKRIKLNRLGRHRETSVSIRVSSPIKATILGATMSIAPTDR